MSSCGVTMYICQENNMHMNKNTLTESILTAMIRMALSKNPNPTNGIALWNATDERKPKNMLEMNQSSKLNTLTATLRQSYHLYHFLQLQENIHGYPFKAGSLERHFIIWLCLTGTGNYQIHKFDWLKSILTTGQIFPSRPTSRLVMLCSEKVAN